MLTVRDLCSGYAGRAVIRSIALQVDAGEIVTLIGANGAGKSTLARTISGLLPVLAGELWLDGREVTGLETARRLRAGLIHVPEGRQIFASLTVRQNIELGAYGQGELSRSELEQRLQAALQRFPPLRERSGEPAGNLSGGQQQMLAIARGLIAQPRLLILDEPSLGLSPPLVRELFELIASLRRQGLAILLAEQNARMSLAIADRAYVMENGRITVSGPAQALRASEDIAARYLGGGDASGRPKRLDETVHQRLVATIRQAQVGSGHE
jgi:branched-chain amino acid transport system ATP-binding protein